mmetsp:Transcript_98781/g.166342  ORF Transcript_98781/g.166342 Transcript_98781/m.166342 type:complete len:150 (-) Transcript_98781:484-933(-)
MTGVRVQQQPNATSNAYTFLALPTPYTTIAGGAPWHSSRPALQVTHAHRLSLPRAALAPCAAQALSSPVGCGKTVFIASPPQAAGITSSQLKLWLHPEPAIFKTITNTSVCLWQFAIATSYRRAAATGSLGINKILDVGMQLLGEWQQA